MGCVVHGGVMSIKVRFLTERYDYMFTWDMSQAPSRGDIVEFGTFRDDVHATHVKVVRVIWTANDSCSVVCK